MTGSIAASIVSHGHGRMVNDLLQDLDRCEALQGATVIVTHNVAETPIDARGFARLKVEVITNQHPKGFGANHNAAFARVSAPYFLVLNPDIRLHAEEPFTALLSAFRQSPSLAAVAPQIVSSADTVEDAVRRNLTPWSLVRRRLLNDRRVLVPTHDSGAEAPFYWLAGMFLLIDSSAYRQVGGFDERFFLYCEDYDLCARLVLAGRHLRSVSSVQVVHDARRDSHRSHRHLQMHLRSLLKVWCSSTFWRMVAKG